MKKIKFNKHFGMEGKHAYLSASNYHWIRYTDEKFEEVYSNHLATLKGTQMHEFAAQCIKLRQKLPRVAKTLNMFVNDAIGYRMESEQMLYFSEYCFGTADAISFRNNVLRIHDLKTGITPAKMDQLLIYAAIFCLEYAIKPSDISIELRIYQSDQIVEFKPTTEDIIPIIDKIISFNKMINQLKEEEE